MRDLFVIIGSLLIAAVLAAFAVPRFIDWTPYKDEIEQRLAMATGLELKLLGPVRLEILPRLSLDAEDVTLDTKEMSLSAAHLVIEVSPASLIVWNPTGEGAPQNLPSSAVSGQGRSMETVQTGRAPTSSAVSA